MSWTNYDVLNILARLLRNREDLCGSLGGLVGLGK